MSQTKTFEEELARELDGLRTTPSQESIDKHGSMSWEEIIVYKIDKIRQLIASHLPEEKPYGVQGVGGALNEGYNDALTDIKKNLGIIKE